MSQNNCSGTKRFLFSGQIIHLLGEATADIQWVPLCHQYTLTCYGWMCDFPHQLCHSTVEIILFCLLTKWLAMAHFF